MVQKHCAHCGQSFEAKRDSAKWCSSLCCNRNHRERNPAPKLPVEVRVCIQCGNEFESRHWRKQACSNACKVAYQNSQRPTTQNEWRDCTVCGTRFQPKQKRGVGRSYCSVSCRSRVRYLRNRDTLLRKEVDYDAMADAQDHKCAICGEPESVLGRSGKRRKLAVDHCHSTETVRGLLCMSCNTGLGGFRDDPARLRAAITYLKKFT